jgi:hypothetical protein
MVLEMSDKKIQMSDKIDYINIYIFLLKMVHDMEHKANYSHMFWYIIYAELLWITAVTFAIWYYS